jgi:hypothetical protein
MAKSGVASPPSRSARALLVLVLALAVVLRLRHAAGSMAFDEMASLYFSGQPWRHLWGWWMVRETNPPLFYSLLKVWRGLVPMGHWPMRALPLAIAFAHLALFGAFVRRRLGWSAALLGLLLFAVSSSDIYQADYLRGYGLAKLAVLASFIGLVRALECGAAAPLPFRGGVGGGGCPPGAWDVGIAPTPTPPLKGRGFPAGAQGWLIYIGGAVVAIHCHTTMVLWPVIATLAVMADAMLRRDGRWRPLAALMAANLATAALSGWVLVMAYAQLRGASSANITWLEPLGWSDFWASCNLQLLLGGVAGSFMMAGYMLIGAWRGRHLLIVRLSVLIAIATLVLFKATDAVHPIVSDFTLHWCFSFTTLVAVASRIGGHSRLHRAVTALALVGVAAAGLVELLIIKPDWQPQDWRRTVLTVAHAPDAALLASHESVGVVIEQACLVELGHMPCPFPLVVMADPSPTDNWSAGGYAGHLAAPAHVRAALGPVRQVYAFSRYYYTPLEHLGLHARDWRQVYWDDGELIGPIPVHAFDPPPPGAPPRVPDPHAEYTGAPDPE